MNTQSGTKMKSSRWQKLKDPCRPPGLKDDEVVTCVCRGYNKNFCITYPVRVINWRAALDAFDILFWKRGIHDGPDYEQSEEALGNKHDPR